MNIIERLYNAGLTYKRDMGFRHRRRLSQRVVSVGNITLGGTGKTPAVIAIAQEALRRGLRPCVLTRGYRGKNRGPCLVSKGNGPLLNVAEAGDEPVLMAYRLPNVEIVKGPDRYVAARLSEGADVFILDDGFQHFGLYRDVDVVLVDGLKGFGNGRLFPLGPLREPLEQLRRADVIVTTRQDNTGGGSIQTLCSQAGVKCPEDITLEVYNAAHRPSSLRSTDGRSIPLSAITGSAVFAFCGIGNPDAFGRTLQSTGAVVAGLMAFPDHHRYTASDLKKIIKKSDDTQWIITTEKDIIKIGQYPLAERILCLSVDFDIDRRFYKRVFEYE
ncbi:MAG: tetraacyldisaccharide 4'-kinase [Nitrospirae bacterium]|nr:tetraacyldisaccharide 4'-kinase [Nitrospirota bacterium]